MKGKKEEQAKILDDYVSSLTAAYTVYAELSGNNAELVSQNKFFEDYITNQEIFKNIVADKLREADINAKEFNNERAEKALKEGYGEAEELLKDEDKIERFLQRLEKKLKVIPFAGEKLAEVPVLASLLRSYVKKEYTNIPIGSIIAIVSALIYFVSPIDIVPDSIPILGYFDDAAVVEVCWSLVDNDVQEYIKWREKNGKEEIE